MTKIQLPPIENAKYIAFSDFDETYLAYDQTQEVLADLRKLEAFLLATAKDYSLMFGWVTGSAINYVKAKIKSHGLQVMPHFVGADLGSTLLVWDHTLQDFVEDIDWSREKSADDLREKVNTITTIIREEYNADIFLQSDLQQSNRKHSYYLNEDNPNFDTIVAVITDLADKLNIAINISGCNVDTGDPPNHHDVDFVPGGCGKAKIAQYLIDRYSVNHKNTFGFGDSGNDLPLLKLVNHGYLVQNATAQAKSQFLNVSPYKNTKAIQHEIEKVIIK